MGLGWPYSMSRSRNSVGRVGDVKPLEIRFNSEEDDVAVDSFNQKGNDPWTQPGRRSRRELPSSGSGQGTTGDRPASGCGVTTRERSRLPKSRVSLLRDMKMAGHWDQERGTIQGFVCLGLCALWLFGVAVMEAQAQHEAHEAIG